VAIVTLAVVTRITGNAASAPHGLLGGALLGFALPGLVIDHIARQRKAAIRRALPAALDMLALSAEAGLSFDGAIGQVAHRWENALSDEFRRLLVEFQMGDMPFVSSPSAAGSPSWGALPTRSSRPTRSACRSRASCMNNPPRSGSAAARGPRSWLARRRSRCSSRWSHSSFRPFSW
jgi:hypothetical protein